MADIIRAVRRDPRYLPILPTLFAAPVASQAPSVAAMFYSLFDLEDVYPPDLRRCQLIELLRLYPTDYFVVVNPAVLVDPAGIAPFIPYIIRSGGDDFCNEGGAPDPPCYVSRSILLTDEPLISFQVGEGAGNPEHAPDATSNSATDPPQPASSQ